MKSEKTPVIYEGSATEDPDWNCRMMGRKPITLISRNYKGSNGRREKTERANREMQQLFPITSVQRHGHQLTDAALRRRETDTGWCVRMVMVGVSSR